MIGFDNGPENGDFVRYIDALLATRAAAAQNAASAATTQRAAATAATPSPFGQPVSAARLPGGPADRPVPRASTTPAPPSSSLRAGAIAASSSVARIPPQAGLIAFLSGAGLVVVGLVGSTFNPFLVFVGAALIYWGLRRLTGRSGSFGPSGAPSRRMPGAKP